MITELEKQFYRTFGIEPKYQDACTVEDKYWQNEELANKYGTFDMYMNAKCGNQENCTTQCSCAYTKEIYPEITDLKLLQLLCIYNDMQGCVELCITPCKYEDAKEMILSTLIIEKFAMINCDKGTYMDVMTNQIQQLFKGGE